MYYQVIHFLSFGSQYHTTKAEYVQIDNNKGIDTQCYSNYNQDNTY